MADEVRNADKERVVADEARGVADAARIESDEARGAGDAAAIVTLSESIGEMVDVVIAIGAEMRDMDRRRTAEIKQFAIGFRRLRMLTRLVVVALALLLVLGIWNHASLSVIHSTVDPGGKIYERNAGQQVLVLQGLVTENDCRSRRQQVRLPAPPDPTKPCVDQTPAEVFPGTDGSPARGAP